MMNRWITPILSLFVSALMAQDTSLTRDFEKLSAKERTRIAKEEEQNAAADQRYQELMREAEDLFRQQRYEASLGKYVEARNLRPYNVYPKVKIQDLQALIKRLKEEAEAEMPVTEVPGTTTLPAPAPDPIPVEVVKKARPVVATVPSTEMSKERPVRPTDPPKPKEVAKDAVLQRTVQAQPKETLPVKDGAYERIIREGRAVVVERQVYHEGRPVIFRKVTHPWGEVVHFQDGIVVPARTWKEEFDE